MIADLYCIYQRTSTKYATYSSVTDQVDGELQTEAYSDPCQPSKIFNVLRGLEQLFTGINLKYF